MDRKKRKKKLKLRGEDNKLKNVTKKKRKKNQSYFKEGMMDEREKNDEREMGERKGWREKLGREQEPLIQRPKGCLLNCYSTYIYVIPGLYI